MNLVKVNKIMNLIMLVIVVYAITVFIQQQSKMNSYSKDILYYQSQMDRLNEKKEELMATEANVNSEEYIEKIARSNLEMYLPTEIVYIDVNK